MKIALTDKGDRYWQVLVESVQISQHSQRKEAVEAATNAALNCPTCLVEIIRNERVVLVIEGGPEPEPTPTPEPEPAPEPDPEPEPEPEPSLDPWFEIDYSMFADRAAMLAHPRIANTELMGAEHMFLTDGAYEARFQGSDSCSSVNYIQQSIHFPERVPEVWLELRIRYDPHFTTHKPQCGQNDHKFLSLAIRPDGNGRFGFKAGQGVNDGKLFVVYIGGSGKLSEQGVDIVFGGVNEKLWDGEWHTVRWHVRTPSTQTAADGAYAVSIDGDTLRNVTFQSANVINDNRMVLHSLKLTDILNDGVQVTASIYTARVGFWRTDPGWDFGPLKLDA